VNCRADHSGDPTSRTSLSGEDHGAFHSDH
jgi:hypothetical protein